MKRPAARQDAIAHYEERYRFFVDRSKDPPDKKPDPAKIPVLTHELLENHVWVISTLSAMTNILGDRYAERSRAPRDAFSPRLLVEGLSKRARCIFEAGRAVAAAKQDHGFLFQLAGELNESGVPLLVGTDTTNPIQIPGLSLHDN